MLRRAFPTVMQAIFLIVLLIIIQSLFGLLVSPVIQAWRSPLAATVLTILGYSVSFGLVILLGMKRSTLKWRERMSAVTGSPFFAFSVLFSVLGLQILISELDNLFRQLLPFPRAAPGFLEQITSGESMVSMFILLAVIAPLAEETLFRGIILRGFMRNYALPKAMVVSALIFAVTHMNIWQFAGAFILGVYLAYIYQETRSLSLCVGAHLLNNAMPFVFIHLLGLQIPGFTVETAEQVVYQPLWLDLLGVVGVLTGAGLTYLYYKEGKRDETE